MGTSKLLVRSLGIAVALAILLTTASWQVLSDEQPKADAPHRIPIATVDVAKVFKSYREFNESMNFLKGKIGEYDREVKFRQERTKKQSPEENAKTPDAVIAETTLSVEIATKRKEFLLAESKAYFEGYQALDKAVERMCKARDIGIVVRANNEPLNPDDRNSVLNGVNRAVVVYSSVPDLTADIIAELNH